MARLIIQLVLLGLLLSWTGCIPVRPAVFGTNYTLARNGTLYLYGKSEFLIKVKNNSDGPVVFGYYSPYNDKLRVIEHIYKLDSIEKLCCYLCTFKSLTDDLLLLPNLKEIWIENCSEFEDLGLAIKDLTSLQTISIKECPMFTQVSENVPYCSSLENLAITHCENLSGFPTYFGMNSGLVYLDLSYNGLKVIPREVENLSHLIYLNLAYNQLTVIIEYMSDLERLEEVILTGNQLEKVPKGLFNIATLRAIDISDNPKISTFGRLKSLPSKLVSIDASKTSITVIPAEIIMALDKEMRFKLNVRGCPLLVHGDFYSCYGYRELYWAYSSQITLSDEIYQELKKPNSILTTPITRVFRWKPAEIKKLGPNQLSIEELAFYTAKDRINHFININLYDLKVKQTARLINHNIKSLPTSLMEYWKSILHLKFDVGLIDSPTNRTYPHEYAASDPYNGSQQEIADAFLSFFSVESAILYLVDAINQNNDICTRIYFYGDYRLRDSSNPKAAQLDDFRACCEKTTQVNPKIVRILLAELGYIEDPSAAVSSEEISLFDGRLAVFSESRVHGRFWPDSD
ncbi:hypothetical protein NEHOM01_1054 [Nematocida homosporus]|uniref:uncharacterized protein n=1 Tax=Nematocida homosporus TaxID=1912981 RepID=UPI0022207F47|nr:uncharacterized protein NEHOM01_1054 [Nematocida homosporus]KAI5185777.1 hypothetical protein NEHOM01_1054 [Nematocida homosporus]